jgi:hypothetical protein
MDPGLESVLGGMPPEMRLRIVRQAVDIVGQTVCENQERLAILFGREYHHDARESYAALMVTIDLLALLLSDVEEQL